MKDGMGHHSDSTGCMLATDAAKSPHVMLQGNICNGRHIAQQATKLVVASLTVEAAAE